MFCAGKEQPKRYSVCSALVKSNQRGIQCDRCDLWTHASCGGVGQEEYEGLYGEWYCPTCVRAELPFADVSRLSAVDTSITGSVSEMSPFLKSKPSEVCKSSGVAISHLNVRSLLPKQDELQTLLERRSTSHVMGLSETWLDESVADAEIDMTGFRVYRKDRNRNGGGVAVYVSDDVKSVRRSDLEEEGIEALWIQVKMRKLRTSFDL